MKKFSIISIIISSICIIGIIIQNYRLAEMFNRAQGKDKALFGLTELTQLDIKVYLGIILIVSLILSIIASIKKENTMYSRFAVILNIFTFILLFMRLWTYLV